MLKKFSRYSDSTLPRTGKTTREVLPPVSLSVINYTKDTISESDLDRIENYKKHTRRNSVTWININGLHDVSVIESCGKLFGLHPLTLEDIINTTQPTKLENFESYLYFVVKMFSYDQKNQNIEYEQISIIATDSTIITFQEREGDIFDSIREKLRNNQGRVRQMKADYLLYALIDSIIDEYFVILENVEDKIEAIEESILTHPTTEKMYQLHTLKREVTFLLKPLWRLREIVNLISKGEVAAIKKQYVFYFRDIYDHILQLIDVIESFKEALSGLLDIYLSSMSNKMNEIMKVLTIIATIFIPLTFIAGIYGMNFKDIPELSWKWGYAYAWGLMLFVVGGMLLYFRRKKWL